VVNPVTRRGVPVCFFITSKEVVPVLAEWLNWVKNNTNNNVKRFMIDCSATEIAAIRQVFGSDANILLCHWHIKRAWDDKLRTTVSLKGQRMTIKELILPLGQDSQRH
jgi:hypothetical protein